MRRREFITLVGYAAAGWPLGARAQQPAMPVVGAISEAPPVPHLFAAFRQGLAEAGYVDGKNVAIEKYYANFRQELLSQLASDLVRRNVNVIVASTPKAVALIRKVTTTIPIVALDLESDPIAKGHVASLAPRRQYDGNVP